MKVLIKKKVEIVLKGDGVNHLGTGIDKILDRVKGIGFNTMILNEDELKSFEELSKALKKM